MKQVLIVRHAIAEDRDEFALTGQNDVLRPLTAAGAKKMRKAAQGLKSVLPELQLIADSSLNRAIQTAEILAEQYPEAKRKEIVELAPGSLPNTICAWLQAQQADSIALVGHEPDLGVLASWLLAGSQAHSFFTFKKGGCMLLEFPGQAESCRARLIWALTPRQLRGLAGATE